MPADMDEPPPVILGVCADAAKKMRVPVGRIRALWCLGGLVLGPVAVLFYLAVYAVTKEE